MTNRRLLVVVLFALLAGLIVNVGVAWWYALFGMYFVGINQVNTPGQYPVEPPAGYAKNPMVESASTPGAKTIACVPALTQYRFGWPMRSLAWAQARSRNAAFSGQNYVLQPDGRLAIVAAPPVKVENLGMIVEGIKVKPGLERFIKTRLSRRFYAGDRRLPVHPLLLGFGVNTALYALPFLGIGLIGSRILVHRRRWGKGLCTRCAYALTGLAPGTPCPECGTPSETQRVRVSTGHDRVRE